MSKTDSPGAELSAEKLAEMRGAVQEKIREAKRAAYAYFCACPIGPERIWAGAVYENVRTSLRVRS